MSKFRRDKKTPSRFHGAFHGGFSAGYDNTVGSSTGWTPSTYDSKVNKHRKQQVQDFMDEEDEETWGGVFSLQKDYQDRSSLVSNALKEQQYEQKKKGMKGSVMKENPMSLSVLPIEYIESAFNIKDKIGVQLLKHMGWNFNKGKEESVDLPPPKENYYGLDYDPYANAPEFKRAQEEIRERAKNRAINAIGGGMNSYHTSNLLDERNENDEGYVMDKGNESSVIKRTDEDFIGNKMVSGFALKDDADDVYDNYLDDSNDAKKSSQYQTHIYEASDSEEENHTLEFLNKKKVDATLDEALKNWANDSTNVHHNKESESSNAKKRLTSDGRLPLPGFELGTENLEQVTRWPGPDVPRDYRVGTHVFDDDNDLNEILEHYPKDMMPPDSSIPCEASHPKQSNSSSFPSKQSQTSNVKKSNIESKPTKPMAGPAFSGLALSMKTRFTSSTSTPTKLTCQLDPNKGGLIQSSELSRIPSETKEEIPSVSKKEAREIIRKKIPWMPSSLLCKRLEVPVPNHRSISTKTSKSRVENLSQTNERMKKMNTEQSYFQSQIEPLLNSRQLNSGTSDSNLPIHQKNTFSNNHDIEDDDEEIVNVTKPPMDLFKSIFQSVSDSESKSSEERKEPSSPNIKDTKKERNIDDSVQEKQNDLDDQSRKHMHEFVPKSKRIQYAKKREKETSFSSKFDEVNDKDASDRDHETIRKKSHSVRYERDASRETYKRSRKKKKRSYRDSREINSDSSHSLKNSSEDERRSRRRRQHRKKHKKKKHHEDSKKRRRHRSPSSDD